MNFESPYVDMPHRLTVRQNLTVFARLYGVGAVRERIGELAADLALDRIPRPAGRPAFGGPEDPRRPGQGAHQRSGRAASRRADRLARPRHRRLGTLAPGRLPVAARVRRSCSPPITWPRSSGFATASIFLHRGRILQDDTPGRLLHQLRPRQPGGGLPRRSPRQRPDVATRGQFVMLSGRDSGAASRSRRVWRAWCCATATFSRSSWPRILDLIYWPTVQMVTWGFIQTFVGRLGSDGRTGRRLAVASGHAHRRRDAVGHPVSRSARLLDRRSSRRCTRATSAT